MSEISKELLEEYEEVLKKHLPQQLGETLQTELKRLKGCEHSMKSLEEQLKIEKEGAKLLSKELIEKNDIISKYNNLREWEDKLKEKERNLEIEILKIQLQEANRRNDIVVNLSNTVFRNSTVQKSIFENGFSAYNIQNGCNEWVKQDGNKNEIITKD